MIVTEIVRTIRPKQWIKNGFIFAALLFSKKFLEAEPAFLAIRAFTSFCFVTSAVYFLNDLMDIKEDRLHPLKSKRPLASGKLKKSTAVVVMIVFAAAGLGLAVKINTYFLLTLISYIILQILYSSWLKHVVILDIFSVAAGFMIRVIGGGLAISVEISDWLIICTALLSLFLAMGKRRHELLILNHEAALHRPILREYSTYLLDQMISVVTASTLVAYCLYTISDVTVEKFGTRKLIYTIPFVLYGIFRYLYLIHKKQYGGAPENLIISDVPLLTSVFLWILTAAAIIYWR
jgi:4-hydroxybenzoate polyprenyltransferase